MIILAICYWNGEKPHPPPIYTSSLMLPIWGIYGIYASMLANLTMVAHKPTIDVEQAPFLLFQLSEPKLAYLKIDSFSIALRRSPSEDC
jgi:hypothetical protein